MLFSQGVKILNNSGSEQIPILQIANPVDLLWKNVLNCCPNAYAPSGFNL
jgi:hypothetical protein